MMEHSGISATNLTAAILRRGDGGIGDSPLAVAPPPSSASTRTTRTTGARRQPTCCWSGGAGRTAGTGTCIAAAAAPTGTANPVGEMIHAQLLRDFPDLDLF